MHCRLLSALILSLCLCVPAGASDTPKKVGIDELMQMIAAG